MERIQILHNDWIPLPLKVDDGYVFTQVCLSVCLSVCQQDILKSYGWIRRKFGEEVERVTKINRFNFREHPDTRIFFNFQSDSS